MRLSATHAFVAALAFALATSAHAQTPEKPPAPPSPHHGTMGGGMMGHGMSPEQCKEKMAAMRASDEELDKLVASMKAATGEAKVDATAAVVEKLVAQRKEMHGQMSEGMCGEKMKSQ